VTSAQQSKDFSSRQQGTRFDEPLAKKFSEVAHDMIMGLLKNPVS